MDVYAEQTYKSAADYISLKLPAELKKIKTGIICGSQFGDLINRVDQSTRIEIEYQSIPGFLSGTGHGGKFVFGYFGDSHTPTVFMSSQLYYYEGYSMAQVTFLVRVMALLGVQYLVVTNTCASLQPHMKVGDLMIINDHLSLPGLAGVHPLVGRNLELFGTRFPALSNAYTFGLRKLAFRAAFETGISPNEIKEGVYCMCTGPSLETKVEARYLASIGADVVGMSTIPEVTVAHHAGIKVLGISLVASSVVNMKGKDAKLEAEREMNCTNVESVDKDIERQKKALQICTKKLKPTENLIIRFADLLATHPTKNNLLLA